ncbi:MAG: phytoene desaturase family protein, partial [Planctomycetota bacterium]
SLGGELQRYFSDPRLVIAFAFQAKYLGMSPFQCPSLFSILSFLEYEYGVYHPMGGCSKVSERMAEIAVQLGAKIRYESEVSEIVFDGRTAVGVRCGKETLECDALVVNSDFAASMEKLVPNKLRRRWTDQKLEKKKYSCSTFMLYLGIEGQYDHLAHHNIHISETYNRNLEEIETRHVLSSDPSFYVQNASMNDPSLAPDGHSALYVLVPVSHQHENIDWQKEQAAFRELTLDRLSAIGMDDIRDRIRVEHSITPVGWRDDYNIYRGATFNLAHNLGQMLHLRPRNRFEDLQSVYLVGGGTHPGSGLPVIYESSRITSRLLLEDFGMDVGFINAAQAPLGQPIPAVQLPLPDRENSNDADAVAEMLAATARADDEIGVGV